MTKLTREEFIKKYNDMLNDDSYIFNKDDLSISLMEDITDSISDEENEELKSLREDLEKAKKDFIELKEKYKSRFLNAAVEDEDPVEELKEEEVIDIKEI